MQAIFQPNATSFYASSSPTFPSSPLSSASVTPPEPTTYALESVVEHVH